MGVYASDMECTGLLEQMALQDSPRLHNWCSIDVDSGEIHLFEGSRKADIQAWFDEGHTFVTHNCATFDEPALQFLGYDTSKIKWIDSLALSWYLEPSRMRHGLAEYGEEFGVPKPKIDNWEDQTQEEYNHRVIEDSKIQRKLWLKQVDRLNTLYGKSHGAHDRIIAFLMQKMKELRQQQDNKWALDECGAKALQEELAMEIEVKTIALREAMPKSPVYSIRQPAAKPYKKSGELSAIGEKWKELTESLGLPFTHKEPIKVVTDYVEGNPASHTQIKSWLDSLGWVAENFKFIREDDGTTRQIPQINLKEGKVCPSVLALIPKCAGIEHIAGLGILNHRHGMVKGFIRESVNGELIARAQGFTNTLRMQHSNPLCNLPSLRVKYGKEIRGLLLARKGKVLLGADLSSLEDRLKHHFQMRIDPEYVKSQMKDGFDPHNAIAVMAGLMTQDEADFYAWVKGGKK